MHVVLDNFCQAMAILGKSCKTRLVQTKKSRPGSHEIEEIQEVRRFWKSHDFVVRNVS